MASFSSFIIWLLLVGGAIASQAQQKSQANIGSVKGIVKDTALNVVLKSATVSVYNFANMDSTLISYQITNTYGEFHFLNLPVGKTLKLLVSNVGYQSISKLFKVSENVQPLDFGALILNHKTTTLKEVVISIPPITMNGDTLEFNADAFKLDTNAVVEDLLRKIPNITLWGDGKISVNGRDVKSLLVNGKEFFGGDFKIATQNLGKNIVEKVQVYKRENETNPLDSTLEMNIKLKKGKELGYFGKMGVGYGTNRRFETDASINAFNSKAQISIVGAANNINKIANDVRTLTANSTFKGVGTRIEYRPDFRLTGITQPKALGSSFIYNFIEKPTYKMKNTLSINYFMQTKANDNTSISQATTTTELAGRIFDESNNERISYVSNNNFDSKYELRKNVHSLIINQSFSKNSYENINESTRNSRKDGDVPVSTNYSNNSGKGNGMNVSLRVYYNLGENPFKYSQRFKGFSANYSLNSDEDDSERINLTQFRSFIRPTSNRDFNRRYRSDNSNLNQMFNFQLNKLRELIFGKAYFFDLDFSVGNEVTFKIRNNRSLVEDLNKTTATFQANSFLSNLMHIKNLEETPFLELSKSVTKTLSNRYSKSLNITASLKQKIVWLEHNSDKTFQNISRRYNRFVPSGNITYNHNRYGDFNKSFTLGYNTSLQIPTIQQLAPLIDSTSIYNIQRGNMRLRESLTRSLSFGFRHEDETTKNSLNYSINVTAGIITDGFADSVFISEDNRRTTFLVNLDGIKYLNSDASIRKAFKLKASELQLSLTGEVNIDKTPSYLNEVFTVSRNVRTSINMKFNFTYKDYLAFEGIQSYNTYSATQETFKTTYSGSIVSTSLCSSYNATKKLALSSNIIFNISSAAKNETLDYTIWNAAATYRFLKGSNLELKLSALDLLRQNKSIINYGAPNSFTIGTQNVLQHYFMATISYFPRQFGKRKQKK